MFQELVPHALIGITNVVYLLFRFQSTKNMVTFTNVACLEALVPGAQLKKSWGPKHPLMDFGHVVEVYLLSFILLSRTCLLQLEPHLSYMDGGPMGKG